MTESKDFSSYLGKRLGTEKLTEKALNQEQLERLSLNDYRNISALDLAQKVRE